MSDEAHAHEIVIIKRHGGGHDEAHHGGVWKIAFADFMTAMMAFFLVMWLISASDKTKASIVKYFNPLELIDSTQQPPGLNKPKKDDPTVVKPSEKTGPDLSGTQAKSNKPYDASGLTDGNSAAKPDKPSSHEEASLNSDPYAVLDEIAAKDTPDKPKAGQSSAVVGPQGGSGAIGLKGGEAFRDPFVPAPTPTAEEPKAILSGSPVVAPPEAFSAQQTAASAPDAPTPGATATSAPPADEKPATLAGLRARIEALGKGANADAASSAPKIEVRRTDEGLLISLTDSASFEMFTTASAEPSPKMVALMAKIGRLLKAQKGTVTVRGFTDSRPFKSASYDNWRLSTARAQMAHYMLVRGGLDDQRIDRVEGYADRHPKNPKDPEGAENRRVEILLRDATP